MDFQTLCIHGCQRKFDNTGSVTVPIFQSATSAHPGVGQTTGYDYSRSQNPTREYLEQTVAALEGGQDAIAFSSGMAAATALMELFSPGDHIIGSDDLYGGSNRLFDNISKKNGISFSYADTPEKIRDAVRPETKAVFLESPTNPMMKVTDIAEVARFTRERGIILIVDNTFLTPYFQKPLSLGADIVMHSGTKYLCGHNDALAGFLVTNNPALAEKLRFISKTTGACPGPFDCYLLIRGIKTLAVRLERQQETAVKIAEWLAGRGEVLAVYYPGLKTHPGYDISLRQASGFGAMISFSVNSEETARRTLERVKLIQYAESLGGVESLITYPMLQTHADLPEAQRLEKGIDGKLLRLSVGLEASADLIFDLEQAITGGE